MIKSAMAVLVAVTCAACGGDEGRSSVTELVKTEVKAGTGSDAVSGRVVTVHYTGWLYDDGAADKKGTKFDSSRDRNEPFSFRLGAGEVIPGWDQGVQGMKVGGKRLLIVPPQLAYGPNDYGPIPGNSTLIFEVELLKVEKPQ